MVIKIQSPRGDTLKDVFQCLRAIGQSELVPRVGRLPIRLDQHQGLRFKRIEKSLASGDVAL